MPAEAIASETVELEPGFYKAELAGDGARKALFEVVGTDVELSL